VAGSNLGLLSSARASLALELYQGYGRDRGLDLPDIGFVEYSLMAAPIALVCLVVAAVVLRLAFPPEGLDIRPAVAALDEDMRRMGPMRRQEWLTAALILGMLLAMVITGPSYLGIVALLSCGAMAGLGLLHWEDCEKQVNWGICLMYGGAIAVGMALHRTGATAWLVERGMPEGLSTLGTLLVIATAGALLTEVVSNAAVVALLLPVTLPLAASLGLSPTTFAVLLPVSAGLAYVLPTSTPAMAMVFGTGSIATGDTMRPGVALTAVAIVALVACAAWLWPLVL
jgi:anion transporter